MLVIVSVSHFDGRRKEKKRGTGYRRIGRIRIGRGKVI